MTDMLTDQVRAITQWLAERAPDVEIDETTVLADGVLTDSFEFVELLVLVEELRGEPIPAEDMELENFRTLRTIADTFLAPKETGADE
ncbi:MAG: hypothetical protein JOZ47_08125 [Kutzneria sp.]|nr:hypothetical protein [Kutzneria sp.]MBV9845021.1 hypothetical protein [Kutzneria sp.]